ELAVCLVEPDAAGRVVTTLLVNGLYDDAQLELGQERLTRHRVRCWPRTANPLLLIANMSTSAPAQFGEIRLLRRSEAPEHDLADGPPNRSISAFERTVGAYFPHPRWTSAFGSREEFDVAGNLSVTGWQAFYDAGSRLIEILHDSGCNGAVVCVAAEGASLTPLTSLGNSPRFDTRVLGGDGPDPKTKDVLELWLRMCDAAGLRITPAVSLAVPLPALEAARAKAGLDDEAWRWIGDDGRSWSNSAVGGKGPHYNLLRGDVQDALASALDEFVARYAHHPSFAGLAIQIDGRGFGCLPGLRWGLDDETVGQFAAATGRTIGFEGPQRFARRADFLVTDARSDWTKWRASRVSLFYASLASRLQSHRADLKLVLCLENALAGQDAQHGLRRALSEKVTVDDVLLQAGLDLKRLGEIPGVALPRPRMTAAEETLLGRALDMRWNQDLEIDDFASQASEASHLIVYRSKTRRLATFDAASPFGVDKTRLALASCASPTGDSSRRLLLSALAERDAAALYIGGDFWMPARDESVARLLGIFGKLPGPSSVTKTLRSQPATLRVFRDGERTTVALYNESPWPLAANLQWDVDTSATWRRLGQASEAGANGEETGSLGPNATWTVPLGPYDLVAWTFDSMQIRVNHLKVEVDDQFVAALQRRIDAIDVRIKNLHNQRTLEGLPNAGFEEAAPGGAPLAWQLRAGLAGRAVVDSSVAHSGS
ncbi:MAG: hypothetical protein KDA61_22715, partial [Planctomycetales bacterium]|nr:hypothetical protein [Planctomycetales bacterium]